MTDAVARHEAALAASIGARHAVAFGYARHALAAILEAAGLGAGDAVALSPLTCKVVPLALAAAGVRPVWVDADAATLNLDARELAAALARDAAIRAVLFQHTYGQSAGLEAVRAAAGERLLVEDCAQCLPLAAAVPSVAAGGARRAAIFSNNVLKPLPAGSGGVAATSDDALAAGIRGARERLAPPTARQALAQALERAAHAALLWPRTYWPLYELARRSASHYVARPLAEEVRRELGERPGRAGAAQARVGTRRLADTAELARVRANHAAFYARALAGARGVALPAALAPGPLYLFPALVDGKEELLRSARRARVELVPWPVSTPIYPVEDPAELAVYGYAPGACPAAEDLARRLVGLPTHARVSARERERAAALVRRHGEGR